MFQRDFHYHENEWLEISQLYIRKHLRIDSFCFWNQFPALSITLSCQFLYGFVSVCEIYLDSGYLVNVARLLVYM